MKLLLDANVSWRLISMLKEHFEECYHVDHIELSLPVSDIAIWTFAAANHLIIVTNDEDFLNLMNTMGFPPKVILLKTGNQNNKYIGNILVKHKPDIEQLWQSSEIGLLEIY